MRRFLVTILVVLLVGILGFLVYMTQAVDFGRQVRVNEHLGNLRTLDAKLNESVLRARTESIALDDLQLAWRDQAGRGIHGLSEEARALDDPRLVANVARLATLYEEKITLMTQYWQATGVSRSALRQVMDAVSVAQPEILGVAAPDGSAARLRADDARAVLERLSARSGEFAALSGPRLAQEIEDAEFRMLAAMDVVPPGPREALRSVVTTLRALRDAQPRRDELFSKLYFFPSAPRTDALGMEFAQTFQTALEQRELYRVYLVFYSGALLVLLAYLGLQLFRSYRVINLVNLQLKRANETLEHKVDLRTRELSDALRHLKDSELMLVQTEKMSSLGQMVAGIAHEINTPLAYVKSSLDSVAEQLPQIALMNAETARLLQLMQSGDAGEQEVTAQFVKVGRLARQLHDAETLGTLEQLTRDGRYGIAQISELVLNLKNFSRLDRTKVARVDLREGLESTLKIARHLVKNKQVIKNFEDIPPVACSPSQINQVFLNLVTNAAQATADGQGVITLSTRRQGDDAVVVSVEDNGAGIAPEVLPRIFDPFFTTKAVGKGTGLGLSIAYRIVEQHRGRLEVQSTVGKGTRFTVTLPVLGAEGAA